MDDRALAASAKAGDTAAFDELVRRHMRGAYRAALAICGCHEDALDASQDAFAKAFRALRTFREEYAFSTWFYRILRNTCYSHLRKRRVRRHLCLGDLPQAKLADPLADPSAAAERSELAHALADAIDSLPPAKREILVLREIEGLSYKELAERLGVPIGTVMSRLYHARAAVRGVMEDKGYGV